MPSGIETSLSWILLNTPDPKYLLFSGDPDCPEFVVQISPSKSLLPVYENQRMLWELLPDSIPEPLQFSEIGKERAVMVQAGAPGLPWFTLRSQLREMRAWRHVIPRMINALNKFHSSVAGVSSWSSKRRPATMLADVAQKVINRIQNKLPTNINGVIDQQIKLLEEVGDFDCHYQHGDFCLNNSLVTDENVMIIDFEHFGVVSMPYHDEFRLMSSLLHFCPEISKSVCDELWQQIHTSCEYRKYFGERHVAGLFLHSLLFWISWTTDRPRRAERHRYNLRLLDTFCANESTDTRWRPGIYFC